MFIIFQMGFNMKHLTTTVFAAAALLMGAHAHAAMVETWSVDIEGLWTAQGPAGVTRDLGDTRLRWGTSTGFGQSSLVITNPVPGLSVDTYVGAGVPPAANTVQTLTLTHANNPITGTSLQNATLTVSLALTPTVPVAPGFPLPSINYARNLQKLPPNCKKQKIRLPKVMPVQRILKTIYANTSRSLPESIYRTICF